MSRTMKELEECFKEAKKREARYIMIRVDMKDFPSTEVIVNPIINVDSKLDYYKKTYDENLEHKYSKGIRIVDFNYALRMDDVDVFIYS